MFSTWKQEKAISGLVDEAQALSDRLAQAKPHVVEGYAAAAQVWVSTYLVDGQDLHQMTTWPSDRVAKFASSAQAKIATLRKQREYDSSDGLAVWLHTARAVSEPRVAPAVRDIWQHLMQAGPNADSMAQEQMQDAGLPSGPGRRAPAGFAAED